MPEMRLLKMSELEQLSGFPRHTIHNYIRHGILDEPIRTGKTMAYYHESHLERLDSIRRIKGSAKLPLSFLKEMLADRGGAAGDGEKKERPAAASEGKEDTREQRKRQIRAAALKVFVEKGFHQTRVQDITATAGVSTGTFYIYYKTKRELFLDVIDDMTASTVKALEEAATRDSDVLRLAITSAKYYMENYHYFAGVINQFRGMMASGEPAAKHKFLELHDRLANPIIDQISVAIKKGLLRDVDEELLASAIMGVVEFLSFRVNFDARRTSSEAISFMIDLIMNGVGQN
jgi:AcrR family transcriptional regulator/predicted DNA-binding transcriptional regulator AlpA